MTSHLTSDELDRLRAVAKAATQFINEKAVFEVLKFAARDKIPEEQLRKDAAHIAAFNSKTCLALLDELTALREENAELTKSSADHVRHTFKNAGLIVDLRAENEKLTAERDECDMYARSKWDTECARQIRVGDTLAAERDQARALLKEAEEALEKIALGGVDKGATVKSTGVALGVWSIPAGWSPAQHASEALQKLRAARKGGAR